MLSPRKPKTDEMFSTFMLVVSFLSLVVMLPMRRKLGFRVLNQIVLICVAFVLYLGDSWHGPGLLSLYALGFLAFGLYERNARWKEMQGGELWHTYSHGVSLLEFLPLRQDRIYRHVDPAVAFIVGLCLRNLGFGALGIAVMLGAIALFIVEEQSYQKLLEEDLNAMDNILEAKLRAAAMDWMNKGAPKAQAKSVRETGGIATGADPEILEQIARRRREAARGDGPESSKEAA